MQPNPQSTWEQVLAEIELSVPKGTYTTWFKNTQGIKTEDGIFFVGVPSDFYREWLSKKYGKEIMKILRSHNEHIRGVDYIVSKNTPPAETGKKPVPVTHQPNAKELPLEASVSKKDNLNPKYTFENFIIGPFNEVAYSAAQATLRAPGTYNPLFIYGSTGLGKTHLIQAVGNGLKAKNPNLSILYINSEKFTNDIISGIQTNKIAALKEKYRAHDVFIMDDIQFLSGKDKVQEELFHLWNLVVGGGGSLLLTATRPAAAWGVRLPDLRSRLLTAWLNKASRSSKAARVMAAGSVMKDPSKGTAASTTNTRPSRSLSAACAMTIPGTSSAAGSAAGFTAAMTANNTPATATATSP